MINEFTQMNWREISYKFGHLLHVGCFVDVFTFESWLPRTIGLLGQYFFEVGLQVVTSNTAGFFFNLSTYAGNLVAEESMRSSELL